MVQDSLLQAVEIRQLLDVMLDGMDPRTQTAVVYHYVDGMTHREIGQILGVTGAAVRKRIAKFRQHVRDHPPDWLEGR